MTHAAFRQAITSTRGESLTVELELPPLPDATRLDLTPYRTELTIKPSGSNKSDDSDALCKVTANNAAHPELSQMAFVLTLANTAAANPALTYVWDVWIRSGSFAIPVAAGTWQFLDCLDNQILT